MLRLSFLERYAAVGVPRPFSDMRSRSFCSLNDGVTGGNGEE